MSKILVKINLALIILIVLAKNIESKNREVVKVGVYIMSIYDLDIVNNSFKTNFWIWTISDINSNYSIKQLDILNAKNMNIVHVDTERVGSKIWSTEKVYATMKINWKLKSFPFDKQNLKIILEDANADTSSIIYTPDIENSKIDSSFKLSGWTYKNVTMKQSIKIYSTNWGELNTSNDKSSYSRITVNLKINRIGWGLFFKLFSGAYVAYLIAMLVFFIDPIDVDPRFGLSVGGLFASVANKYVVDSSLPSNLVFSLADEIHLIVFVAILIAIILSVISLRCYKLEKFRISKKIDLLGLVCLFSTVLFINIFFVIQAIG